MNGYKKIFRNADTRKRILSMLNWIPDKAMLKLQYRIKLGRKLNLKNPKRYSEKLQWYKVYYRDQLMKQCVDKYNVREYVKSCGYGSILNDCFGVFDSPDDIDVETLPDSFVLKDTLGSGGNSVILVRNKHSVDWQQCKDNALKWVNVSTKGKDCGREWVYENMKHRILVEKMLELDENQDLPDYKFFCFNGKVFCSYMMKEYAMHHEKGVLGFLDRDFKLMPVHRADFAPMTEQPEKPINYDEMIKIAEKLSAPFPHVRVDLYNIKGKIVFGELTFFNASGYVKFNPDEFDYEMGEKFVLPEPNSKK